MAVVRLVPRSLRPVTSPQGRLGIHESHMAAGTPEAFEVTVRPALDSLDAFMDRLRMQVGLACVPAGRQFGT